jgi:ketosteroid isomerase-like protein
MSRENVEVVRRSFEVWNEGDVDAIRRLYTEDVVIETPEVFAIAGPTFAGDDPVGRFVAGLKKEWIDSRWEVERIFDCGDVIVSFHRTTAIGRRSGAEVSRDFAGVFRIRDGLIASEHIYLDRDEALEAAGLRK